MKRHVLGVLHTTGVLAIVTLGLGIAREHPAPAATLPAPELHYAPVENLEAIDVAAIGTATKTIDMAAYILNDWAVIGALRDAARRGVIVRIYRNHSSEEREGGRYAPSEAYKALAATPGVTIRIKRRWPLMHLKSYAVDGTLLRTGSANFTPSGEKSQDNDLVLTRDPAAIARFAADFARMWGRETLREHCR